MADLRLGPGRATGLLLLLLFAIHCTSASRYPLSTTTKELSSGGIAGDYRGSLLGQFERTDEIRAGAPVYRQRHTVTSRRVLLHRESGYWVVEEEGKLPLLRTRAGPSGVPAAGWEVWTGGSWTPDPLLRVRSPPSPPRASVTIALTGAALEEEAESGGEFLVVPGQWCCGRPVLQQPGGRRRFLTVAPGYTGWGVVDSSTHETAYIISQSAGSQDPADPRAGLNSRYPEDEWIGVWPDGWGYSDGAGYGGIEVTSRPSSPYSPSSPSSPSNPSSPSSPSTLELSSGGIAGDYWGDMLGQFDMKAERWAGAPGLSPQVYRQRHTVTSSWKILLYRESGYWVVKEEGKDLAALRTRAGPSGVPASGWEVRTGGSWTPDPLLRVRSPSPLPSSVTIALTGAALLHQPESGGEFLVESVEHGRGIWWCCGRPVLQKPGGPGRGSRYLTVAPGRTNWGVRDSPTSKAAYISSKSAGSQDPADPRAASNTRLPEMTEGWGYGVGGGRWQFGGIEVTSRSGTWYQGVLYPEDDWNDNWMGIMESHPRTSG